MSRFADRLKNARVRAEEYEKKQKQQEFTAHLKGLFDKGSIADEGHGQLDKSIHERESNTALSKQAEEIKLDDVIKEYEKNPKQQEFTANLKRLIAKGSIADKGHGQLDNSIHERESNTKKGGRGKSRRRRQNKNKTKKKKRL